MFRLIVVFYFYSSELLGNQDFEQGKRAPTHEYKKQTQVNKPAHLRVKGSRKRG